MSKLLICCIVNVSIISFKIFNGELDSVAAEILTQLSLMDRHHKYENDTFLLWLVHAKNPHKNGFHIAESSVVQQ